MKAVYLLFTDASQAEQVLAAIESLARDDVGVVLAPTGAMEVFEGIEVPVLAQLPGWHVNLVVWDGALPEQLMPHRIDPPAGIRRFAGVEEWQPPAAPPPPPPPGPPVPPPVPEEVTMRQARIALLQAGKLAAVDAAIAALPEPQRSVARIEWEFSSTVRRQQPLVQSLGPALDLAPVDLDQLFRLAATL